MKTEKNIKKKSNLKIIILGIFTGFLSGLFASGGGLIAVPRISLFYTYRRKGS